MSDRKRSPRSRWTLYLVLPVALVLGFVALLGCSNKKAEAAEDTAVQYKIGDPVTDSTIAVIVSSSHGTDTLKTAEFRSRMQLIFQRFPMIQGNEEQSSELRRNIVEDFIMRNALFGEADKLGIKADTARVAAQISRIRSQYPTPEAFQQALAAENISEDSLRSMISEEVRLQMLQEKFVEKAKNPTTPELETFRKEQAEQIRAQHILFPVSAGAGTSADSTARSQAQAVLDSAKAGVNFGDLARRHSADATAAQGGDLDYFSKGQMVPAFEKAAFALSDSGDVTQELVHTRFGYHIIRLTGKRTAELMDTSRARQMMLSQRRQKTVEEEINRLKREVTVRLNPAVVKTELNVPQVDL